MTRAKRQQQHQGRGGAVDAIADLMADFREGKMVILVDDEDRENEGDLVVAAECVTAEHINFMASKGRGLICLALTEERCAQLELPLMVSRNQARFATNFTVSIEAARGVTTGISAQDRARTVLAAVKEDARPGDLVSPGHIFPIKAQPGGVLTRAGHTEAGIDLARLCGRQPASVICEILGEDGSMARLPDLIKFARANGIRIGTIADLIKYRLQNDPTVERVAEAEVELRQGRFRSYVYRDRVEGGVHIALAHGEVAAGKPTLVRVHVHRGLLDAVLQAEAGGSWSVGRVLEAIAREGGVLVLLAYNESVEELAGRLRLEGGEDVRASQLGAAEAVEGAPDNLRMLGAGGQILADLGVGKVLALGRERRTHGLSGFGLEVVAYIADAKHLAEWRNEYE